MWPRLYVFHAYHGSKEQPMEVYVVAGQKSTAWQAAVEKANRKGPFALTSLAFVREDELPDEVSAFASKYNL